MKITALLAAAAASSPLSKPLEFLPLPPHPRLLADNSTITSLRAAISNGDPTLQIYFQRLVNCGNAALAAPLTPYPNCTVVGSCRNLAVFGANSSYINTSALSDTIVCPALLYRINLSANITAYTNRAIAELLHLSSSAFPSWYWPVGQALERAATAFAVALGYDWLYPLLSPVQREVIEGAIGAKALLTRLQDERQGMWWTQDPLNWNINSNGPLIAAAVAVMDVPAWTGPAQAVVQIAMNNMPAAVASWAPYGIWPEGPGYLSFTYGSQAQAASALVTATGSDGGILSAPGVCTIGMHNIHYTGPSGTFFNWGDSHASAPSTPAMFFSAAQCRQPVYAAFARLLHAFSSPSKEQAGLGELSTALDMVWYSGNGSWADIAALPPAVVYADPSLDTLRGAKTHYGSFRSCWGYTAGGQGIAGCPSPVWLAFKGGQNHFDDHGSQSHNNHGHLDVSSFVLESGPESYRWAVDLGADDYDYPLLAYFGRFRFGYYYLSSVGHNVLSFDGDTQHRRGEGRVVASSTTAATGPWATVDTTSVHGGAVYSSRSYELTAQAPHVVILTDQWSHPTATTAVWTMHTTAQVSIQGAQGAASTVLLTSPTGRSSISLAATAGAVVPVWAVRTLDLPVPQSTTYTVGGVTKVPVYVLTATVPASAGTIAVTFTPLN